MKIITQHQDRTLCCPNHPQAVFHLEQTLDDQGEVFSADVICTVCIPPKQVITGEQVGLDYD